MTISLYTRNLGIAYSNAEVIITEIQTGLPATIYAGVGGGIVTLTGRITADVDGAISMYLDDSKTWAITRYTNYIADVSPYSFVLSNTGTIYGMTPAEAFAFKDIAKPFRNSPVSLSPWWTQPSSFTGNPRQDATLGDVSSSKDRISQFAGMPDRVVVGDTSRFGGNLQWGTKSVAEVNYPGSSVDTTYTASPSAVETSASSWLKHKNNLDGTQEFAMGRVTKYTDGRLRFMQYADDNLVGGCPRVQWYTSPLISKQGTYLTYLSVQFGDVATPFPAYVSGKDAVLFYQLKDASVTQPIISAVVEYDSPSSETLKVTFNIKPTDAGSISTISVITGLAKNTRHDFVIESVLDWGSNGYWGIWYEGNLITIREGNTLMSDVGSNVEAMLGIYRYNWATKASANCAIIFHLAGIKNIPNRIS